MSITKHIIEHLILGLPIDGSSAQLTAEEIRILTGRQGIVSANSLHNHTDISSHFGTTDGLTNGYISFGGVLAYISDSVGQYDVFNWAGTNRLTSKGAHTYITNGLVTDLNLGDTIYFKIEDSSNNIVYSSTLAIASYNQTNGVITLSEHSLKTNGHSEGKISVAFNYSTVRPTGGYCKLTVSHTCTQTNVVYTQVYETFADIGTTPPTPEDILMTMNVPTSNKYLSGIRYFSLNDTGTISCSVPSFAHQTYIQEPLVINATEFGMTVGNIAINNVGVAGVSVPPKYNEELFFSRQYAITEVGKNFTDAKLYALAQDQWGISSLVESTSSNILCNTVSESSTSVAEYFEDEAYRLPEGEYNSLWYDYKNKYDSSVSLVGTHLAQVFGGSLIKPSQNFMAGWLPSQTNADYSSIIGTARRFDPASSGWCCYTRAFYTEDPKTKATVDLGMTMQELETALENGDLYIFVKLPSKTGWLSFNKRYDISEFAGINNDGCRYEGPTNWQMVFGNISTALSCYTIIVEIWVKATSPEITQFVLTDWEHINQHPCTPVV